MHAEVAPHVRLVEEMEENKGDRLAQFNVLTAEQPSCEGPNCTTANSSCHVAGHWVHTHMWEELREWFRLLQLASWSTARHALKRTYKASREGQHRPIQNCLAVHGLQLLWKQALRQNMMGPRLVPPRWPARRRQGRTVSGVSSTWRDQCFCKKGRGGEREGRGEGGDGRGRGGEREGRGEGGRGEERRGREGGK